MAKRDVVYIDADHGHSVFTASECQMCHLQIPPMKDHPSILEIQNGRVRRSFPFCDTTCRRLYQRKHLKPMKRAKHNEPDAIDAEEESRMPDIRREEAATQTMVERGGTHE